MLRLFFKYSRGPCGVTCDVELLLAHVSIKELTSTWADNLQLILGTSVHMTIGPLRTQWIALADPEA